MTTPGAPVAVRLRIDIGPDCSIGPGKIALLEQIERSGSLSEAARVLKMSYRRAWLLLEDLNRTLGHPVTTASVGGAGGGGAKITPFGRQVAAAFREIETCHHPCRRPEARMAGAVRRGPGDRPGGAAPGRESLAHREKTWPRKETALTSTQTG